MSAFVITIFVLGYIAIAFEQGLNINKAATALITGVLCWVIFALMAPEKLGVSEILAGHLGELSGILFFLMGAMTIVELIDSNDGFDILTSRINITNKKKLIWIIAVLTFFLSAILDNLTTTIVVISLLRKLVQKEQDRLLFAGIVVIAANAGGAWSPIGDVTTTMLWIGNQVTAMHMVLNLFLPSVICLVVPTAIISFRLKGDVTKQPFIKTEQKDEMYQAVVLLSGILVLVLVPVFKALTNLPPYMGILLGLGILWIITEVINTRRSTGLKGGYTVIHALQKIDMPSILFFLGILLSIAALQESKVLENLAVWLGKTVVNQDGINITFGLISSVIDNVPLVAAAKGMYSLNQYPTDHSFWVFLAYCTGTGGSALIIGSAAGVAAMGLEKIGFFWYLKRISFIALLGYFSGALVYIIQTFIF